MAGAAEVGRASNSSLRGWDFVLGALGAALGHVEGGLTGGRQELR